MVVHVPKPGNDHPALPQLNLNTINQYSLVRPIIFFEHLLGDNLSIYG
jgi:hypothetical protein